MNRQRLLLSLGLARLGWLFLLALWLPAAFATDFSSVSVEGALVTNGAINAMAVDNATGITYIGGAFTSIGPNQNSAGLPIDASTGSVAGSFPKVNNRINAVAADGSGGWYIGGDFTTVGGLARNRLAHITAAGTVDAWNPNADNSVWALAVSGSTVYVGGNFTTLVLTTSPCPEPQNSLMLIGEGIVVKDIRP